MIKAIFSLNNSSSIIELSKGLLAISNLISIIEGSSLLNDYKEILTETYCKKHGLDASEYTAKILPLTKSEIEKGYELSVNIIQFD